MRLRTSLLTVLGAVLIFTRLSFAQASDASAAALQKAKENLAAAEADGESVQTKIDTARHTLIAEEAWAARQAATKAEAERTAAEKDLAAKAAQAKTEQEKAHGAAKAAEHAAGERVAAEMALEITTEDKKAEAKKTLDEKTVASQKATDAARKAKETADLATAQKAIAEKTLAEKTAVLDMARDAAALSHAQALGGLKPITSDRWDYARARHLLFRAGFGGTPEEVQKLVDMGPYKAVEFLVEYHKRPMANIEVETDIYSWERPLAYEGRLHAAAQNQLSDQDGKRNVDSHAALVRWWVRRLLESPRPLEEKLVLFWHSHFASSYRTLGDTYLMYQQNQFFRRYADNFEALLHGIVQDPAMIRYLNNDDNVKDHVNENLGRELLELFSLGEENSTAHKPDGYTEKDVRDANTRSLTGAGYEHYSAQFRFYHARHDTGSKTLLGNTGNWGTHEAVDIMLQHPATSRYLTKKLWQYFAYAEPERELIDRLAHVFRENGFRIRPVLTNLFLSEQFYSERAMVLRAVNDYATFALGLAALRKE